MGRSIFDPDVLRKDFADDLWDGLYETFQQSSSPGRSFMKKPDDIIEWIVENNLVNEKGKPLEFDNHKFLIDMYRDMTPKQVVKKCAQIGYSVTTTIKNIFLSYFENYTIIYTLPTREMVFEYVPTKVDIIIAKNPVLQQMIVQKDSSTQKKRSGDGFILYKGTFGEREAIMTSSDLNTYDECDRSNLDVIEGLESRLGASDYKGQWWFSNPTFPSVGVCKKYDESDQKKWHVICQNCKKEFPLEWETCVCYDREVYACPSCLHEISDEVRSNGFWVAHQPGKSISGYHISKVIVPWVSCPEMIKWERDKKPDIFHNYDLGEGYMDGTKAVTRDIIEACETPRETSTDYLAVGIDQGSKIHAVIGPRHGITDIKEFENWEQVDNFIASDNIKYVVIDAQPERREAIKLAQKYPYKVFVCYYIDDPKRPAGKEHLHWKDSEGIVTAERTMTIDEVVQRFLRKDINVYLDSKHPLYKHSKRKKSTFVEHWESMYTTEKIDNHGNLVRRWDHSGPDHFAHATNYWNMAVSKLPRKTRAKKREIYVPSNPYTGY